MSRADEVEQSLIESILQERYPVGSRLPLERELAVELGVGRPTLREALQRLARDGWITVRRRTGTIINEYWRSGSLNIIGAIARHDPSVRADTAQWLLELRVGLAPTYVRQAVANQPARAVAVMVEHESIGDGDAEAFARFDWRWQLELSQLAPNPLFHLINRNAASVWARGANVYFAVGAHRAASRAFYEGLLQAAMDADPDTAEEITRHAMQESIRLWRELERRT